MYSTFRILCFSHDEHLQQTRRWILETRYEAVCVASLAQLQGQASLAGGFDVVILCHSLSADDRHAATMTTRQRWPQAKIVAMAAQWNDGSGPCTAVDRVVRAQEGPAALMSSLAEILPRKHTLTAAA